MSIANMMKKFGAFISSYNEEFDDFKVKFLYPSGYNKYYCYPEIEDSCHLNKKYLENIGCSILKLGTHRIQYYFEQKK